MAPGISLLYVSQEEKALAQERFSTCQSDLNRAQQVLWREHVTYILCICCADS